MADLRDPPRDERVARVVGVIAVPYVKPIVRRRRDRIDCRFVWPAKVDARLARVPATPRKVADERVPAPTTAPRLVTTGSSPAPGARELTRAVPTMSLFVGGLAAACGFVLGRVATGGRALFAASLAVGLALLVTFVLTLLAQGEGARGRSNLRGVTVLTGALALTAVVMAGAGVLRPL